MSVIKILSTLKTTEQMGQNHKLQVKNISEQLFSSLALEHSLGSIHRFLLWSQDKMVVLITACACEIYWSAEVFCFCDILKLCYGRVKNLFINRIITYLSLKEEMKSDLKYLQSSLSQITHKGC